MFVERLFFDGKSAFLWVPTESPNLFLYFV